jgi:hypothetical protein
MDAAVQAIPISGPAVESQAKFSGMAWYSDTLILLPKYPDKFGNGSNGAVFTLTKADILAFLDGKIPGPLEPAPVPLVDSGLASRIKGFEGYEAIAVQGNRVYLTVEARPNGMLGYLLSGRIDPGLKEIRIDTSHWVEIPPEANLPNMAYEALLIAGKRIIVFYEANSALANPHPVARSYDANLVFQGDIALPNLEYRLTDITPPNTDGQFWAINTSYPDKSSTATTQDSMAENNGHDQVVERLVELHFTEDGIAMTGRPPIQLLVDSQERNWEGIARLDKRGFLLITDQYPSTILGFVAGP